jgi:circadian clock protein KaiC
MKRITTGDEPLDRILGGGIPANSLNIIMGNPGSGKTILAEKMAFANANAERPVLYLTTISEPMAKVLTYLQQLSFVDPSRIGTSVLYESLGEVVTDYPERLVDTVQGLVQQHRPAILVIDSFKAIGDMMGDVRTWRRTLHRLAGLLTAYATTSFWVGEYSAEMIPLRPEFAVVDGVIELTRSADPGRAFRFLQVRKLRGSSFLDGFHTFEIRASGLDIYPRLVTPPVPPSYQPAAERLPTGIAGLDELIESGWLRGTSTLIAGPSGAGKTVLGLHYLRAGVAQGEPGLLVSFEENPTQLGRIVSNFGWPLEQLTGPDKLDHLYASPVELHIDTIIAEIFRRIDVNGVRRIVIDSVSDLEMTANDPRRLREYLYSLVQWFAVRNVTAMFTFSTSTLMLPSHTSAQILDTSHLHDNIILLGMELGAESIRRTMRITKTRGSAHDGALRTIEITGQGIAVR